MAQCYCEQTYNTQLATGEIYHITCKCGSDCAFCNVLDNTCGCIRDTLRQTRHGKIALSNACNCLSDCDCFAPERKPDNIFFNCRCEEAFNAQSSSRQFHLITCGCDFTCAFCTASDCACPCDRDREAQIRHGKVPRSNACACDRHCICFKCVCEQATNRPSFRLVDSPLECQCDITKCSYCAISHAV